MGDMVEYYDERTDDTDWAPRKQHRTPARIVTPSTGTCDHYPSDDEACKSLISALGVYDWKTTKTQGSFSEHPYRLTADVGATKHTIHLPRRRGTVLAWLKEQRDARRAAQ